mmetsp:Transcript_43068/g.142589  ORF Transcript_43068/g.142589 Transcript_43068/m.142589 type:complete len:189 (-) Transcript_43068:31-597(-)
MFGCITVSVAANLLVFVWSLREVIQNRKEWTLTSDTAICFAFNRQYAHPCVRWSRFATVLFSYLFLCGACLAAHLRGTLFVLLRSQFFAFVALLAALHDLWRPVPEVARVPWRTFVPRLNGQSFSWADLMTSAPRLLSTKLTQHAIEEFLLEVRARRASLEVAPLKCRRSPSLSLLVEYLGLSPSWNK